jgi:hypothetical protein
MHESIYTHDDPKEAWCASVPSRTFPEQYVGDRSVKSVVLQYDCNISSEWVWSVIAVKPVIRLFCLLKFDLVCPHGRARLI